MSAVTNFLTDPTVHNALLSSMAVTALISAMPPADRFKGAKLADWPVIVYQYIFDVLHTFMSLKSGGQIPAPPPAHPQLALPAPPIVPAQLAPESQPATTATK